MKYIAIITATDEEITAIKEKFNNLEEEQISFLTYWKGIYDNKNYIITQAGIGKVNAAVTAQILIDNFEIEYVVNIGAAGALNEKLDIADIVIGERLVQHDYDISPFGYKKGYILGPDRYFYSDKKLVNKAKNAMKEKDIKIITGTIATGDVFCNDNELKEEIKKEFNADCVEMEGASIAQVCFLNKIPFLVIRSISDRVNGTNEIEYGKFAEIASEKCASFVLKI